MMTPLMGSRGARKGRRGHRSRGHARGHRVEGKTRTGAGKEKRAMEKSAKQLDS